MRALRKDDRKLTPAQRGTLAQINALITRARGFRSAAAQTAMIDFVRGGLCPIHPTHKQKAHS